MKMSPSEARNHAKRHNRIEVKVSDEELEIIRKKADAVKLPVSSYMRRTAVAGEIKIFDLSELHSLRSVINLFGSNVNQIAMVANSMGNVNKKELEEVIRNQQLVIRELHSYYEKLMPKAV
jgi:uncharacterized protein (DUF39 family)